MTKSLVAVVALTLAVPALAQEAAGPAAEEHGANAISVNVLANIGGAYSVEYERVLSPSLTAFVEPTFFRIAPNLSFGSNGIFGPGAVLGVHWHPFGAAPAGLFVAPELYFTYITPQTALPSPYQFGMGAGAVVGWSFVLFKHLLLSPGLGATVNFLGYNLTGAQGFGWLPILRTNIGVAF